MKKMIYSLAFTAVLGTLMLASCTSVVETSTTTDEAVTTEEADAADETAGEYYCPMKCEDGKTYAEAGKCASCDMDLVKKGEENTEAAAEDTSIVYNCPMKCQHENVFHKPGKCPSCDMEMVLESEEVEE